MKKFWIIFNMIMLALSFNVVNANTINSIKMDIYVDEMGHAHVTEVWDCYADKNTEWYHTYNNIGQSQITNFTVIDEDMVTYTNVSNWNVNGSFEEKKYKSGINKTSQGIELCFGISEYNTRKIYTTNYKITNFVANLTDSQMIYWTLLDFSQDIGEAYIKIHSDFEYSDTVGVWGFGNYGGTAYVYDGYIEMQSPGKLEGNEYMTILVQFPQNTFNGVTNNINNNFDDYLNMANEGAKKYRNNQIMGIAFVLFFFSIVFFSIFCAIIQVNSSLLRYKKFIEKKDIQEIKKDKNYYRDIPCNKSLFRAFFIAQQFGIIKKESDLFGAVLLDWLRKNKIRIEKKKVGFFKKKDESCIVFEKNLVFEDKLEKELYNMLYKASKDGILEPKELDKWCNHKYNKFFEWFGAVINEQLKELVQEKVMIKKGTKYELVNIEYMKGEGRKLIGLKNFLNQYTMIESRKAIEVNIFEEYLIFAQMLGIAKKVIYEFRKLYPELIAKSTFTSYEDVYYIYNHSYKGMMTAESSRNRAASNYSSGGGGFSSGGGGGGSFGGGRRWL